MNPFLRNFAFAEFRDSYSRTRMAVPEGTPFEWLFPQPGSPGRVFVLGVKVKATLLTLRLGT